MYIEDDQQGRLEDADGLPYTLDFLVLEELDFMHSCLRAPPVRKELESQLEAGNVSGAPNWVAEVMALAVAYGQITTEEEGLWDIDVNIFLSEETSVTANYTPRTACGDLVLKLAEWLPQVAIQGLLEYTKTVFSTANNWKPKESALYVLNQVLTDFSEVNRTIQPEVAKAFVEYLNYATQQEDVFLRARGYLVAGTLTKTAGPVATEIASQYLERTLKASTEDPSEVVQASCIRVLQIYIQALPKELTVPLQGTIITAVANFLTSQDPDELADSNDVLVTLAETLREVIAVDPQICIAEGSGVLDLLFTLVTRAPDNFQLTMLVDEALEEITEQISSMGGDSYAKLCEKVLPQLIGAFDVANVIEESALTSVAAGLLAIFTEKGSEPLPFGFVEAVMPKLTQHLLSSSDGELLRPGTDAVKNILSHDPNQLFDWHDSNGKSGLEVCLVIIDRLLGQGIDDNSATQVGALAAELVVKAGNEKMGPYLPQLLQAVAIRLSTANEAAPQFIQNLILVFARLCLQHGAKDVVDFLAQTQIGTESGLQVVIAKWLENSVNFAGYDEIRQKFVISQ
jgi:importin-9